MADRYTRLSERKNINLYTLTSPILICSTAITKDNDSGAVLAQVKFQNLDTRMNSLTASFVQMDSAGRTLGAKAIQKYLDLNAETGEEFGAQTPVTLHPECRAFDVEVTEVVFADKRIWTAPEGSRWTSLPEQKALFEFLGSEELAEQYRRETNTYGSGTPLEYEGLWFCSCATVNKVGQESCRSCNTRKERLFSALDKEMLTKKLHAYQAEKERERQEQERLARMKEEEQTRKKKKLVKQAAIIVPILALSIVLGVLAWPKIALARDYAEAKKLVENGDYDAAMTAFAELGEYKDSAEQIPATKYEKAIALRDVGDYDGAVTAFAELGEYKDSADLILATKYEKAIALRDVGDYDGAVTAFGELGEYKDSAEQFEATFSLQLKNATVGSTVYFGSYEQENYTRNGKEPIQWRVLAKEGNRVLLISEKAIDCQLYNNEYAKIPWENCTLRKWLNEDFLSNAFSSTEQAMIQTTTVSADKNLRYNTDPGNSTNDKVFLLSITEAEEYFGSDEGRKCVPTDFAKVQGAHTSDNNTLNGEPTCWWWLRSPGFDHYHAAYVGSNGAICDGGSVLASSFISVRPAMWITLD